LISRISNCRPRRNVRFRPGSTPMTTRQSAIRRGCRSSSYQQAHHTNMFTAYQQQVAKDTKWRSITAATSEIQNAHARVPTDGDLRAIRTALAQYAPRLAGGRIIRAQVCWYTVAPDATYIIGWHPDSQRVAIATACNGVGMKPAAAIGEALTDL